MSRVVGLDFSNVSASYDSHSEDAPSNSISGASNEASPASSADRLKSQKTFEAVMQKQVSRCAVTIKHVLFQKEQAIALFKPICHYVRCGREDHEEEKNGSIDHLHLYLQLIDPKRLGQIYKMIETNFPGLYYGRPDVRQLKTTTDAAKWNNYCKKDGDYIDEGELKLAGPQRKASGYEDETYHSFLDIARQDGPEAAMVYASEKLVKDYCTRYAQLFEAAKSVQPPPQKYTAPSMHSDFAKPRPWQKHFLPRIMDVEPVRRRIHWVNGKPGNGKTWIKDYVSANHPCGVFEASDRCAIDHLSYSYNEEGVVMWDFPKNFDWDTMESAAASVIEKFSDFGSKLRSLKYKGRNPTVLCHVVVFANRPCPDCLRHRDIVEFDIDQWNSQHPPEIFDPPPITDKSEPVKLDVSQIKSPRKRKVKKFPPRPRFIYNSSDSDESSEPFTTEEINTYNSTHRPDAAKAAE